MWPEMRQAPKIGIAERETARAVISDGWGGLVETLRKLAPPMV
jgi:hypothetical protein